MLHSQVDYISIKIHNDPDLIFMRYLHNGEVPTELVYHRFPRRPNRRSPLLHSRRRTDTNAELPHPMFLLVNMDCHK